MLEPRPDASTHMIRFPTFRATPTCEKAKTAQESLREILAKASKKKGGVGLVSTTNTRQQQQQQQQQREAASQYQRRQKKAGVGADLFDDGDDSKMGSSKGEPTDPELRERIKEEVKAMEKGMFSLSC